MKIEQLQIGPRALNILRNDGYVTVADIRARGRRALMSAPSCGEKTIAEIENAMDGWGDGPAAEIEKVRALYRRQKRLYRRAKARLKAAKDAYEAFGSNGARKDRYRDMTMLEWDAIHFPPSPTNGAPDR